jgi:hypothetical protein
LSVSAHDVTDLVAFAPTQHFPTTELAIGVQRDIHPKPLFLWCCHKQQNGPGVLGRINVTGAQITNRQPLTAEDVEGQKQ